MFDRAMSFAKWVLAQPADPRCGSQTVNLAQAYLAVSAHSENLAWSLLHALAALDDALWTLERVNGRAQGDMSLLAALAALRDIRVYCERKLNRG